MKNTAGYKFVGFVNRFVLLVACGAFVVGAAYSQGTGGPGGNSGSCTVTQLSLRFATSNDDLRGGQDNLNIVVYFTNRTSQIALNVNGSNPWHNNSVNLVYIHIKPPVPPNEIRAFRLVHVADGSINWKDLLVAPGGPINPINIATALQSPDNWNMADMEVAAVGNGVDARIASYGSHRFTGSNPDLIVGTHIPPNICGSGRPTNNSGGQGQVSVGNSGGGSGTLLAPSQQQGMLAAQPRSAALFQGNRVASKVTSVPNSPSTKGTVGDGNRSSGASGAASAGSGGPNTGAGLVPGKKLTNEDVVAMLSQRVQEQTILQRIQSSPSAFDVSSGARAIFDRECLAGRPANETPGRWAAEVRKIWDTMTNVVICRQTNGRGGEGACGPSSGTNNSNQGAELLTPQPLLPKGGANMADGGKAKVVLPPNLKVFTLGETQNPAALSLIRSIKQLKGTGGGTIGPEGTMSAPGNVSGGASSSVAATRPMLAGPAAMQPNSARTSRPQPQGGTGPSGNSRFGTLPSNSVIVCTNQATGIGAVNGQRFTQFTPGTRYVITGCGFGSAPGKVYLTGAFPAHNGRIELGPYWTFGTQRGWAGHWSDQRIDAQLDEALAGELDQYNVSLVVETSTGQQIQMGDVSFKAQRAEFMLRSIPSSALGFNPNDQFGVEDSPCTSSWVTGNCTVDVFRQFGGTTSAPRPDTYTINLKSGFVFSRAVLLVMSAKQDKLTGWTTPEINGNQITVHWIWEPGGGSWSLYGLQIYVIGPLGVTDAWAGQ